MKTLTSRGSLLLQAGACAVALGCAVLHSGCLAVAAGAGAGAAVAYSMGKLDTTVSDSFESVVKASQKAITQLQFAKVSETKDALNAVLIARTALDKKVEIRLTKIADKMTKMEIRVGIIGDETQSMAILDKIRSNL